jgi:hypothetical protein
MKAFRDVLQDCSLSDLGFQGSLFTWTNGREGDDFIKERLDRAVANHEWCVEASLGGGLGSCCKILGSQTTLFEDG